MKYPEFKRVYIDKTTGQKREIKVEVPFKAVEYSVAAKKRTADEIIGAAEHFKAIVETYTGRANKWNGKITIVNDEGVKGAKAWDCGIVINVDAPDHVLIHELIHGSSISHYGQQIYSSHSMAEELSVHFLSQELALSEKVAVIRSGYDEGVELIRKYRRLVKPELSDLEFAAELIKKAPDKRWAWLEDLYDGALTSTATVAELQELSGILEEIIAWTTEK